MKYNDITRSQVQFAPLTKFLAQLNSLHYGIASNDLLEWDYIDGDLVITGNPLILSALFSLLWSNTSDYAFYFTKHVKKGAILAKYLG